MNRVFLLLVAVAVGLSGCNNDRPAPISFENQLAKDRALIDSYLVIKGIAASTDPDDYGVRYFVNVEGNGIKPAGSSDSVTVNYTLRLLPSESEIEKSAAPVRFLLGDLIAGWQIGLPLIKQGSKANFYVPSGWAYGSAQQGNIPPNSNLIFEIELLKVFPQLRKDTLAINDYLVVKEIKNVLKGPEGLKYIITSLGTGVKPVSTSTVSFSYTGRVMNINSATPFGQQSLPSDFALSGLIKGLRLGIPLIPVGTKATFYVPSTLGYGLRGSGSIPSNANLIFEIELTGSK
jgi:FKBP-type peptidyl-prolyl cis-trans isomerase FkpA